MGSSLTATETLNENIAPVPAMQSRVKKAVIALNDELFQRVLRYRTTMATIKIMLEKGLISAEEYDKIDTKIAAKYSLELSVIYR